VTTVSPAPLAEVSLPFEVSSLRVSPSGRYIAVGTEDEKEQTTIHAGRVRGPLTAFSADAATFVDERRLLLLEWVSGTSRLRLVRGLAYYTGFVFEAFDRKGDLRALAGGGRYNDLIKKLGYPDLPSVGFAAPDVYCVIGGAPERTAAFGDIQALRAAGYRVDYPLKEVAFGKQFKAAAESGAKLALVYGGDELAKGVVKLRDLTERTERDVPRADLVSTVRDFFSGG